MMELEQVYVDIENENEEGVILDGPLGVFSTSKYISSMSVVDDDDDPLVLNYIMDGGGGKEKCKKGGCSVSAKKPPKPPPHPHRGFSLDAASVEEMKLIREVAELAMIKRARIERMKAVLMMQKKPSKAASNATLFGMIFTIIFFLIILFQGMACQNSHGTLIEASPQTNQNIYIYSLL